jgi:hypothetical protein
VLNVGLLLAAMVILKICSDIQVCRAIRKGKK